MSLVAYAASSDEESDNESAVTDNVISNGSHKDANGHISDEDDYYESKDESSISKKHLSLPAPSKTQPATDDSGDEDVITPAFEKLPEPKVVPTTEKIIEEDDEFLHKKATGPAIEKPQPARVKITIPSLSAFKDIDDKPAKPKLEQKPSTKSSGLLGMLPKPKHDTLFSNKTEKISNTVIKPSTSLIPDSVKNRSTVKSKPPLENPLKPQVKRKPLVPHHSDSEDSASDAEDFFSLNADDKLPEVKDSEINALVAKKAAEMAEASSKFDKFINQNATASQEEVIENQEQYMAPQTSRDVQFDDHTMQMLVGSRAKRRKMEEVQFVELSSQEVLPNKDEWLRSALASETGYQPVGILTDEEVQPGTRKKHQITYLAHQAKANEQELQAMWSANRHTRRQTQSKYGF